MGNTWIWIITLFSALMFAGTLIGLPFLVARIPEDYFVRRPIRDWQPRRPFAYFVGVVLKNLLGAILLVAGVAMLVLPGQGLLTILAGLMLLDFPYKRYWERQLISVRPVREAANWIRQRHGYPPLKLTQEMSDD